MNNEELNKIMMKADANLEALKDRCHELYEENKELKENKKKVIDYIKEAIHDKSEISGVELLNILQGEKQ